MKVTELPQSWQQDQKQAEERNSEYRLRMPLEDAARLAALAALYEGKSEREILDDIANSAIEDLAALKNLSDDEQETN